MLPVVAGARETKRQMLLYTLVLVPAALAPTLLGAVGWLYGSAALALSLTFIGHALAVWRSPDDASAHGTAKRMFRFSLIYLAALFPALPLERVMAGGAPSWPTTAARATATCIAASAPRTWWWRASCWLWW